MTYDALLAVSLTVNIGLTVVVVAMGLAMLVVLLRNRDKVSDIEELRVQLIALRKEIEAQRAEFSEASEAIKRFGRD